VSKRPYNSNCPIWRASTVLGHPCTLMILRELFLDESCRFQDFDARSRGFSKNTVSNRLKALVDEGFVEMKPYDDHPPRYDYQLTKRGRKLGPIIEAMFKWGNAEIRNQKKND